MAWKFFQWSCGGLLLKTCRVQDSKAVWVLGVHTKAGTTHLMVNLFLIPLYFIHTVWQVQVFIDNWRKFFDIPCLLKGFEVKMSIDGLRDWIDKLFPKLAINMVWRHWVVPMAIDCTMNHLTFFWKRSLYSGYMSRTN